jgi:ATP-dependent Clp protease ATP-binding subunit ClpX
MSDEPPCCSFCFNHDIPLFEGGVFDSTTRICAFCATRALAEITPQPVPEPAPPPERPSREARLASIPTPKTLVTHLDQFVIGQDIAKKRLALGVSNHFKRLVDCWDRDAPDPIVADADLRDVVVEKSNILLIGPSGSGKTHLVKSLASYLNVPLVIGDATSLTEAGYVGDDVESLLSKLILTAEGDIEVAQRGIVYIDEIDKIQRSGSGFKDLRLGVQHSLLKMLEGTIATVPPQGGYKHPAQPGIPFDTTNVLFICGGAFVGLEEIIGKRLGRGGFGFGQMSENRQVASDGLLRQVKPEDLEAFGLIPEIIGRLPVIAPLDALGVEDLARILQTPKNSWVQQFRKLVRFHGADLMFTDAAIREIARIALERGTGARGLRSVVEEVLEAVMFDPEPGVRYVITDRAVRGGEPLKRSMSQPATPLGSYLWRRFKAQKNRSRASNVD